MSGWVCRRFPWRILYSVNRNQNLYFFRFTVCSSVWVFVCKLNIGPVRRAFLLRFGCWIIQTIRTSGQDSAARLLSSIFRRFFFSIFFFLCLFFSFGQERIESQWLQVIEKIAHFPVFMAFACSFACLWGYLFVSNVFFLAKNKPCLSWFSFNPARQPYHLFFSANEFYHTHQKTLIKNVSYSITGSVRRTRAMKWQ